MLEANSCEVHEGLIDLSSSTGIEFEIKNLIQKMNEGDSHLLKANHDFSESLIMVIRENFSNLPLKAKFMEDGPTNWIIKIKYPKAGEGCCGCC